MNVINQGETDLQKTREAEEKLEVNNFNTLSFWTVIYIYKDNLKRDKTITANI